MFKFLNINIFNKLLFSLVIISVLFSFFIEYILGINPCKLCLFQRYLWISLLCACTLSFIVNIDFKKYIYLVILSILMAIFIIKFLS